MAEILARELRGDLDVVLVRKLRAPGDSELAVGAITEGGLLLLREEWEAIAPEEYLKQEASDALALLHRRRSLYTPGSAPLDPRGRTTIVVDDGIATGATMSAALRGLRGSGAARVVVAAAVAPREIVDNLRREADEVVCLRTPEPFHAVSQFYHDFSEVTDEDVIAILRRSRRAAAAAGGSPPHLRHGNFGMDLGRPPR